MEYEQKPLGIAATVSASQELAKGLHAITRRVIYDLVEPQDIDVLYQRFIALALRLEAELIDYKTLTTQQLYEQATVNYLARIEECWELLDGKVP